MKEKELASLISYVARGHLSNDRVQLLENGNVLLKLKRPFSDGTHSLELSPYEFIAKLAALVPQKRFHLIRWSGVFAPASKHRKFIVLKADAKKGFTFG